MNNIIPAMKNINNSKPGIPGFSSTVTIVETVLVSPMLSLTVNSRIYVPGSSYL